MHVCLEPDTNYLCPTQCPEKYTPVWKQTINGFAPMSYSEVKFLCLEPDRLRFVFSIVFKVIWSVSGNDRIILGSHLSRKYTAYVSGNRH